MSSLVVYWTGLGALLDKLIRYVVEGPKPVALVRRRGASGFDINLLDHSLRENKVPRQVVTLATPTGWQFDDGLFSAVVLDPTWNREEVHQFSSGLRRDKLKHKPGIHFFDSMGSGEMVSCTIPSVSDYQPILEAVSYTHLRAHETVLDLVCRLLLEKKNKYYNINKKVTYNHTTICISSVT